MSVDTSGSSDEDKPIFRPLTRDSLAQIQARIDSEHAKKKELLRKRAEGEVSVDCRARISLGSPFYPSFTKRESGLKE